MSVASSVAVPQRHAVPRPRAATGGRLALLFAVILVTSVSAFALSLLCYLHPIGDGDGLPGYAAVAPHRAYAWAFFVIAGVQLIVGACAAALAAWSSRRARGARWATVGGALIWLGAAVYGVGIGGWATVYYVRERPADARHRDRDAARRPRQPRHRATCCAVPIGGAVLIALGASCLSVGLWRARTVPRWVPIVGGLSAVATVVLPPNGAAGVVAEAASSISTIAIGWYALRTA